MNVGLYETVLVFQNFESSDVHVLTDGGDHGGKLLLYGKRSVTLPGLLHEAFDILCFCIQCLCGHFGNIVSEYLVLCNEVGLGVNFYENTDLGCFIIIRANN